MTPRLSPMYEVIAKLVRSMTTVAEYATGDSTVTSADALAAARTLLELPLAEGVAVGGSSPGWSLGHVRSLMGEVCQLLDPNRMTNDETARRMVRELFERYNAPLPGP